MTVVARRIAASPARSAGEVWTLIIDMLAPKSGSARTDLLSITGIACSLIASEVLADAPLVTYGSGPRVRVYCLYGEDAITPDDANEAPLSFCPTEGDWHMSLPCLQDDLAWVQQELALKSTGITAREKSEAITEPEESSGAAATATVNMEAFLRQ